MLIYLIRHGLTRCTQEKRYQGVLDTPLSEMGRAALRPAGLRPALVYVTPLLRTCQTAEILFPGAAQAAVPGLGEMDFGIFEGKNYLELADSVEYRAWVEGNCLAPCPGGEDRAGFTARVCAAFQTLVDAASEDLYIVAHGGTQMAVLSTWVNSDRSYYAWCAKPGAGYVLDAAAWPERLELVREISFAED